MEYFASASTLEYFASASTLVFLSTFWIYLSPGYHAGTRQSHPSQRQSPGSEDSQVRSVPTFLPLVRRRYELFRSCASIAVYSFGMPSSSQPGKSGLPILAWNQHVRLSEDSPFNATPSGAKHHLRYQQQSSDRASSLTSWGRESFLGDHWFCCHWLLLSP